MGWVKQLENIQVENPNLFLNSEKTRDKTKYSEVMVIKKEYT